MGFEFVALFLIAFPVFLFIAYIIMRTRYKKAGPDEALIVFGRRKLLGRKVRTEKGEIEGFRIIRGGGTFVWPAWEQYEILSLRMMTLEIDLPHVYTIQGIPINVCETEGAWLDVIYPWDILNLNGVVLRRMQPSLGGQVEAFVNIKGRVAIGNGTVIHSNSYLNGPIKIGRNCEIGPNVCLLPATSIGDNVVISSFTEIRNSVIGNDVTIGPGCIIQDSVIDQACDIKGHMTACSGDATVGINNEHHNVNIGAMMGENCTLDYGVVAQPGMILGNYSQVQAMKLIKGYLPDKSLVF